MDGKGDAGFPNSEKYAEAFKNGFQSIVGNGRYVRILEHYYGKNKIPAEYRPLFDSLGVRYGFQLEVFIKADPVLVP